jgi:hypothetical protein
MNEVKMKTVVFFLCSVLGVVFSQENIVFLEAEGFEKKGDWVIDQQFMDIMGSPYLLAHGLGIPVKDAVTSVHFTNPGMYHIWVRTKDWAPYPNGPGEFRILINDIPVDTIFGASGSDLWQWYYGGKTEIKSKGNIISINDLSGFDARCDAILFAGSENYRPPEGLEELGELRERSLGIPTIAPDAGNFDFVVVGGGIAGICAAVSASRSGLKVALIQNRPVLGGNNSSEVRVHLMGKVYQNPYPRLGRIVKELDNGDPGNAARMAKLYGDHRKLSVVRAEKNLKLFLNMHAYKVEKEGNIITAVIARHIENNKKWRFSGKYFADCTGDATIGFLSGADFRIGREGKNESNESLAPEKADNFTLGSSNLWNASEKDHESTFPECPWAIQFSNRYHLDQRKSDWRWETGFGQYNTITEAEKIRDHNFRAIYGNWSYLKNNKKSKYANWELAWVAYISGKRESRRLLGDLILTEQDI